MLSQSRELFSLIKTMVTMIKSLELTPLADTLPMILETG